jgi:biopolymer transport protein ExbB/TolQ
MPAKSWTNSCSPRTLNGLVTWETISNLIRDEWAILSLLLVWSIAGLTIICERIYSLWKVLPKSEMFKAQVIEAIEAGDLPKAQALCETSNDPLAVVYGRGFKVFAKTPHKTTEAVMSQRTVAIGTFKRYLWALGTVGSSAPFVGLFGTVVGILKAFQSMSVAGTGGFKVVSQGIAAALVATAAGLLVAIYAIIAYNYFVARVGAIAIEYKVFCEEFLLALGEYAKKHDNSLVPVPAPTAASGKNVPSA